MNKKEELSILINASYNAFKQLNIDEDSRLFNLAEDLQRIVNNKNEQQDEFITEDKKQLTGFLCVYRALHEFSGGDVDFMNHWLVVKNRHFNALPRDLLSTDEGVQQLIRYFDALGSSTPKFRV